MVDRKRDQGSERNSRLKEAGYVRAPSRGAHREAEQRIEHRKQQEGLARLMPKEFNFEPGI